MVIAQLISYDFFIAINYLTLTSNFRARAVTLLEDLCIFQDEL